MENVHIVFGHSAAAGLREALLSVGNKEKIVNCWGDYQAGPIAVSLDERFDWLCEHYYDVDAEDRALQKEYIERSVEFTDIAVRKDVQKILWYGELCTSEYCGYLEFLHRAHGEFETIHTVEVCSALPKENTRLALSAGSASPEYLVKALPSSSPISADAFETDLALWSGLRQESAALRVLTTDGMISADISFFDEAMLDFVTNDFQSAARVVGHTLGYVDGHQAYCQGNSDLFYFSRLKELHRQGRIEWQGSQNNMREAAVRLAS